MQPSDIWFPREVAEEVRKAYPHLWSRHGTGGNPPTRWTGDDAYRAWGWLIDLEEGRTPPTHEIPAAKRAFEKLTNAAWRGPTTNLFQIVTELWMERRANYITRHQRDFRPGGIIAMIKWAGIFPWAEAQDPGLGYEVMVQALDDS